MQRCSIFIFTSFVFHLTEITEQMKHILHNEVD